MEGREGEEGRGRRRGRVERREGGRRRGENKGGEMREVVEEQRISV